MREMPTHNLIIDDVRARRNGIGYFILLWYNSGGLWCGFEERCPKFSLWARHTRSVLFFYFSHVRQSTAVAAPVLCRIESGE